MLKLSNFWENYSQLLNKIGNLNQSLMTDSNYKELWNVSPSGELAGNITKEKIIDLLTSADILGELGDKIFDYDSIELQSLISVFSGDNSKLIKSKISEANDDLLFNGFGPKWKDVVKGKKIKIFDGATISNLILKNSWIDESDGYSTYEFIVQFDFALETYELTARMFADGEIEYIDIFTLEGDDVSETLQEEIYSVANLLISGKTLGLDNTKLKSVTEIEEVETVITYENGDAVNLKPEFKDYKYDSPYLVIEDRGDRLLVQAGWDTGLSIVPQNVITKNMIIPGALDINDELYKRAVFVLTNTFGKSFGNNADFGFTTWSVKTTNDNKIRYYVSEDGDTFTFFKRVELSDEEEIEDFEITSELDESIEKLLSFISKYDYSADLLSNDVDDRPILKGRSVSRKTVIPSNVVEWLNSNGEHVKANTKKVATWYNQITGRNFIDGQSTGGYPQELVLTCIGQNYEIRVSKDYIRAFGEDVETKKEFEEALNAYYNLVFDLNESLSKDIDVPNMSFVNDIDNLYDYRLDSTNNIYDKLNTKLVGDLSKFGKIEEATDKDWKVVDGWKVLIKMLLPNNNIMVLTVDLNSTRQKYIANFLWLGDVETWNNAKDIFDGSLDYDLGFKTDIQDSTTYTILIKKIQTILTKYIKTIK